MVNFDVLKTIIEKSIFSLEQSNKNECERLKRFSMQVSFVALSVLTILHTNYVEIVL